jgi:benzoylformate decarboxylase
MNERTTVRDATFAVLRERGIDRIFANPGSTEIAFLTDLPDDLQFVLSLHEGSVVGMATGHAIATGRPAFVNLHTTAGLGNAVGALATARVNRAPLVVVVGQQDRKHLALEPFLAGRLTGLAGSYPVWTNEPVLAADVPGAIRRACHEAAQHRGPAIVIVPSDDWLVEIDPQRDEISPRAVLRAGSDPTPVLDDLVQLLSQAVRPAIVAGAGVADQLGWDSLVRLAERLGAPVWQEAFGAGAGFPQDHPQFAGHLPASRSALREAVRDNDLILVVGTSAFRQYTYEPGPLVPPGVAITVICDDPDDLHHSRADLGVLGSPAAICAALADVLPQRDQRPRPRRVPTVDPPRDGELLRAAHVFAALAARLPKDAVVVEETPSSRPELHELLPARMPRGFVSAAMGGLGFALPAAAGLRMGDPSRGVVALLGDGSSLYAIQGLWSAARYGCGVLFVVLSNGRYAVMDQLASNVGGKAPWPAFDDISIAGLARSLNCPALEIGDHAELIAVFDDVLPGLAERTEPLLLDVTVTTDAASPRRKPLTATEA